MHMGVYFSIQNKVLMIFADIHMEIIYFFASCDDKIGITKTAYNTCTPGIWNCPEYSGYESGNGYFITWNDSG